MVLLHVKRGDESQFLLQAPGSTELEELTVQVARVYNGRLKVQRLCSEMEELAEHGIFLPPNMQGLTDDQIEELKLKDEWGEKCVPSGGAVFKKDDIGRRNGQAPNEKMKQVLKKTIEEAKAIISKKQVEAGVCVTMEMVKDALDQLRGAVMIVYPMGLPPYDPIRMEFENKEDLSGTQAGLNVIKEAEAQLWWAAKELRRTKKLSDYVGKNEKTKIIAKIQQPLQQQIIRLHQELGRQKSLWADVHGKLRSHIDALREQNMELREKLRALQLQRWKARKKSAASPHAGQESHTLALEPAFGKISPLSADEETIPKYAGHKNQSATLLGQRSSSNNSAPPKTEAPQS
uniref:CFAP298-TCP10L readthrough n=2 Tax=Homo sapiens TaxID=9606 RepID=A0A5F9ZHZ7_HUMAN